MVQFTRLRLSGFKSFVDPTELAIEPGLTGIVGPNGCGKSNLVEAVRWVMGENSPKRMRGSGMEDVIFAGTNNRSSRNWAEVSLRVDNADRKAPSQFNDTDELEIVRRIERDVGSAYRINGREVRMRDVQLFFADNASGPQSPALVRQGQIGQLISAKPKDRRAILEEAAGIAGLHSRRHEAELRLRAAENNLTRLDDIMQQIEGQLAALKRQARQASRYRNLSGHIRRAEAILFHLRWSDAEKALAAAKQRLDESEALVGERARVAANASTRQTEAAEAVPPLRQAEAEAAAALHRLAVERDNLDIEEQRARDQLDRAEAALLQIRQDMSRESSHVDDAKASIEKLEQERRELRQGAAEHESEEAAAADAVRAAEDALREAEEALESLTVRAADLGARRESLSRVLEESDHRLERLEEQRKSVAEERGRLQAETARTDTVRVAGDAVVDARNSAQQAQGAAETAERERTEAQAREAELREKYQEAASEAGRLKAEEHAAREVLALRDDDLWPPLIDAVRVTPGYEAALGAALGDDLELPADEAAPAHWSALSPLPDAPPLPQSAEPLERYVDAPPALARRLSQVGVVRADDGPHLRTQLKTGQRLVSVEGDLWRWDGLTSAADAPTAAAKRLSLRNNLEALAGNRASAEAEAERRRALFEEARADAEKAVAIESDRRREARAAEERLRQAIEAHQAAERAAAALVSRLGTLKDSHEHLEEEIRETSERRRQASDTISALEDEVALGHRIMEQRADVTSRRGAYTEARGALDALTRESEQRQRRLDAIENEVDAWRQRVAAAEQQFAVLEERRSQLAEEREQLLKVPDALRQRRVALLDKLSDAEARRNSAADQLAKAEQTLQEADRATKDAQNSLSEAREDRARLQASLEAAEERREDIAHQIAERLEVAPEKVIELAEVRDNETLPSVDQIEARLERLKRERENMGAVNLRAEQEAQELSEQLESMQTEKADLEGAIARLRQGIASLNREGRERLLAAFQTVNDHFTRLFTVLFGGGHAQLQLTESDDPLEAGLEIMARPPGKRLQVMSLLSGGEQALTALALIFAVFLTNPSPICVLDEVDAPLDDANVERFCNMLDDMVQSAETRFLVITHHAYTMARMHRLFGVTMAERGVSQLVSVDLERAEELRAVG